MANLLALALIFAALVALATAHTTIVTTTKEEEDQAWSSRWKCDRQMVGDELNICPEYLKWSMQIESKGLDESYREWYDKYQVELCCNLLHKIDQECQCDAMEQVFQDALRMMQVEEAGTFGVERTTELRQKTQQLPNQCNLQLSPQCQVANIRTVITTVVIEEDTNSGQTSRGSQQCSEVQGRQFNQCQIYIQQQQQQSGSVLLMRINRQGQQQQQELGSCCNELENVQRECQCDAIQEVYEQALRQQQQQQQEGRKQSGSKRGVEQQMSVQRAIENLKNECNLEVQQCRIPSAMF